MLENADLTHAATTQPIRPTYRPIALAKLDQRTKEARLMRETRAALVAHVGGRPTAVQSALIERAAQLSLRIAAMDRRFAELGEQTDHDSRTYLAWSNSLTRTLAQLGVAGATTAREPSIAEQTAPRVAPADPETPRGEVLASADLNEHHHRYQTATK